MPAQRRKSDLRTSRLWFLAMNCAHFQLAMLAYNLKGHEAIHPAPPLRPIAELALLVVSGELIRWKRNDRIREARSDQERKHQMV